MELCEDGFNTPVTFSQRFKYVQDVETARIAEVVPAVTAMSKGLSSVVPLHMLKFFTCEEIEVAVCGHAQLNVRFLQKYSSIDERLSGTIEWLWETLEGFTPQRQVN